MKKMILLFVLFMNYYSLYASTDITIEDSHIKKDQIYEEVKKWALTTLDSKGVSILYEDKESGDIIIEGKYVDKHNSLSSNIMHYVYPYVKFQLEVRCDNGIVKAEFIKLNYSYNITHKSTYDLNDYARKLIIKEFDALLHVMRKYGESFEIGDAIEEEYNTIEPLYEEAKQKKDDKSLSSKERKEYNKIYENNRGLYEVYHSAHWVKYHMVRELLKETEKSLFTYISNHLAGNN